MEEEKNAFYVVRKGDVLGIYRSLSDCQAQVGSSIHDRPVSVFKGYCLPKEAEEYLKLHGLKNASYTVGAADMKNDVFGKLAPCHVQPGFTRRAVVDADPISVRINGSLKLHSTPLEAPPMPSVSLTQNRTAGPAISSPRFSCILEFDGASKGNPGPAGAGAVLRDDDGSAVWRFREGLGIATNNVAEYRALILGLRCALQYGFKHIRIRGDSNLVCMQVQGLWKTKNQNMADLCKEAIGLKDRFSSFQISHVPRELNMDADTQANIAINLQDGQIQLVC